MPLHPRLIPYETVRTVYKVLRKTEKYMSIHYDYIEEILPHDIFFVTTSELAEMFPDYSPKEREYYIAKAKGAVCIMQIGETLENGKPHDGRAPDYDDWWHYIGKSISNIFGKSTIAYIRFRCRQSHRMCVVIRFVLIWLSRE
jgi:asparagine synthetase A